MATETVGAPIRVFDSILPALAVPARFILFGASVIACVYAWLAMLSLADQYNGGINVVFMIISAILALIAIIITIAILFDGPPEQGYQPAFALAIVHWFFVFIFMVIAGETYPLPQERSPWVEPTGRVYYEGQEAPRHLFGGTQGAQIDPTYTFTTRLLWYDVGEASGLRLRIIHTLTFDASLSDDRETLQAHIRELLEGNSSMRTLNNRLWSSARFAVPSEEELTAAVQSGAPPETETIYDSEQPWTTGLTLRQIARSAELTGETEAK